MSKTQITIEFESSEYEQYFIKDISEKIEYSEWKPKGVTLTVKEEFE